MKQSRIRVALGGLVSLLIAGLLHAQTEAPSSSGAGVGSSIAPSGLSSQATTGLEGPLPGQEIPLSTGSGSAATPATPNPTKEEAAPIRLPEGFGGASGPTITPGTGRFAQPPIRFTLSLSMGYDDNVTGAPDNPGTPVDLTYYELVEKRYFSGQYRINGGGMDRTPIYLTGTFLEPRVLKAPPQQKPVGSPVARTNIAFQTQSANARTVYTLDLGIGVNEYWNRPGDTMDYTGNAGFLFHHLVSPRMTFTAGGSLSVASQPNYGSLYGPTAQNTGQYMTGDLRATLGYRLTPRISTQLTYNLDTTLYQETTQQTSNLYNNTTGMEFRYLFSPRATAVFNYRVSSITYPQSMESDSTENFMLFGADIDLSRRIHFTFRTGAQSKTYTNATSTGLSSPYFESDLNYIYGKGSTLSWNTRYGFQETPNRVNTQKTVSFRTGLSMNHVLSPKLFANAGLNYNRLTTSSTLDQSLAATDQDQLNVNLGLNYLLSPRWNFNLSYIYTQTMNTLSVMDSTRNQTFLGVNYSF